MREVKALYRKLTAPLSFTEKYPECKRDNKIHVLFVGPCLCGSGYYRMILPALELNRTRTHSAIVTEILKWNFNKSFDDYNHIIDARLILWADYVVLPAILTDAGYFIDGMKRVKSNIRFIMDMDMNYHEIPEGNAESKRITDVHRQALTGNLLKIDLVTSPNKCLLGYYKKMLQETGRENLPYFLYLPNVLSPYTYQEVPLEREHENEATHILLTGSGNHYADFESIIVVLKSLREAYGSTLRITFFGWDGKKPSGDNLLAGITCNFERSVSFTEYFNKLHYLDIDIILLPSLDITFNVCGKSTIKYLEAAALGVPVVASNNGLYNDVIEDGHTGFLATTHEEWKEKIIALIEDGHLRKKIGSAAQENAWKSHSFTKVFSKTFERVFI
ncbi:glycosyltransferase family 4 protein [Fulvivirga sp. 29W222]|uniref:Glycosyltransferase family 4 protein n=1 Tax=Fulvivirga marina TaxID=2494733 RepID=A0A937FWT4_9BACT|nr:glycosyltransferase [Fulvivirga marina]MBL6447610.1 glycosyltransferase family 4 protein [Fulvivirga marina]